MLTALWLVPVAGGVLVGLLPRRWTRPVGLLTSGVGLALALAVAVLFQRGHSGYQFEEYVPWIRDYSIAYHVGIDGIGLWLVLLNALLTVIAILAAGDRGGRPRGFIALILMLEGGMAGVFLAADLLLFYVFWEAQLIPAYFLLWQWGEPRGEGYTANAAATKFLLYTLVGSLLALVGVIGEYVYGGGGAHTFDLRTLAAHPPSDAIQFGLFFLFALAFAIKVPLFPFHGWLPDAYAVAPIPLLVTFAGVMGKTGAYAMLRILIPLLPHPTLWWDWNAVMPALAVLGIAWGALMALAQRDVKLLVAYSSVSHMGFIVLGIFAFNQQGQQGAVLQMVNHGIIIAALFLLVGWVSAQTGTRDRALMKDLAPRMPVTAGAFLVVTLAALGLPILNSFVGEFMTLLGAWQYAPWLAVAACLGLVLAPVYMLRLFQGLMYAGPGEQLPAPMPHGGEAAVARTDIASRELVLLVPLLVLMFLLGLYPYLLTQAMTSLGFPLPVPWR
ncbi:MAG TPA: NADH-quinone oxidoreductase subunit M [Candidatus Dormibacteraeota bacterium]|nr:NADH-quinone oxidoreductase subunit M [Candidatus Dormibacteraeota bacterium]